MNILGLFPLTGNGGIASWASKFLKAFPDQDYVIFPVDVTPWGRNENDSGIKRLMTGIQALCRILSDVRRTIRENCIDVMHTTTSGSLGSLRDICVARICRKYKVKTIMHCRYGCITEDITSKGLLGALLRKSMSLYDQIWVLDSRSYQTLKSMPSLASKVYLTPNPIDVTRPYDPSPKKYERVAFIGNLIPSKGLYELIEAALMASIHLDIVGPASDVVAKKVKEMTGENFGRAVVMHGKMTNSDAVRFMETVDVIALPTYYPSEAFPISIIEAMSLSKLVISCPRAAIPDMLTGLDGSPCGILVRPGSVSDIADALTWCRDNKTEADELCRKAYEKVFHVYRTEVVYELYRNNYRKLWL